MPCLLQRAHRAAPCLHTQPARDFGAFHNWGSANRKADCACVFVCASREAWRVGDGFLWLWEPLSSWFQSRRKAGECRSISWEGGSSSPSSWGHCPGTPLRELGLGRCVVPCSLTEKVNEWRRRKNKVRGTVWEEENQAKEQKGCRVEHAELCAGVRWAQ